MPRTTAELVAKVVKIKTGDDIDFFIATATSMVDEFCAGDAGPTPAYAYERLEQIETYLAAHFYHTLRPLLASEGVGSGAAQRAFRHKIELGLQSTMHGQTAIRLDTNGGLARANSLSRKATAMWLGVDHSENRTQE